MVERRRFMRFDVLFDALCKRSGALKKFKVENFSREGIGIVSDDEFDLGEQVDLEMSIPGDNVPVVMSGEVAWADEGALDMSGFKGGLKFEKIENTDRSRILDYVYSRWLMPKKKAEK